MSQQLADGMSAAMSLSPPSIRSGSFEFTILMTCGRSPVWMVKCELDLFNTILTGVGWFVNQLFIPLWFRGLSIKCPVRLFLI